MITPRFIYLAHLCLMITRVNGSYSEEISESLEEDIEKIGNNVKFELESEISESDFQNDTDLSIDDTDTDLHHFLNDVFSNHDGEHEHIYKSVLEAIKKPKKETIDNATLSFEQYNTQFNSLQNHTEEDYGSLSTFQHSQKSNEQHSKEYLDNRRFFYAKNKEPDFYIEHDERRYDNISDKLALTSEEKSKHYKDKINIPHMGFNYVDEVANKPESKMKEELSFRANSASVEHFEHLKQHTIYLTTGSIPSGTEPQYLDQPNEKVYLRSQTKHQVKSTTHPEQYEHPDRYETKVAWKYLPTKFNSTTYNWQYGLLTSPLPAPDLDTPSEYERTILLPTLTLGTTSGMTVPTSKWTDSKDNVFVMFARHIICHAVTIVPWKALYAINLRYDSALIRVMHNNRDLVEILQEPVTKAFQDSARVIRLWTADEARGNLSYYCDLIKDRHARNWDLNPILDHYSLFIDKEAQPRVKQITSAFLEYPVIVIAKYMSINDLVLAIFIEVFVKPLRKQVELSQRNTETGIHIMRVKRLQYLLNHYAHTHRYPTYRLMVTANFSSHPRDFTTNGNFHGLPHETRPLRSFYLGTQNASAVTPSGLETLKKKKGQTSNAANKRRMKTLPKAKTRLVNRMLRLRNSGNSGNDSISKTRHRQPQVAVAYNNLKQKIINNLIAKGGLRTPLKATTGLVRRYKTKTPLRQRKVATRTHSKPKMKVKERKNEMKTVAVTYRNIEKHKSTPKPNVEIQVINKNVSFLRGDVSHLNDKYKAILSILKHRNNSHHGVIRESTTHKVPNILRQLDLSEILQKNTHVPPINNSANKDNRQVEKLNAFIDKYKSNAFFHAFINQYKNNEHFDALIKKHIKTILVDGHNQTNIQLKSQKRDEYVEIIDRKDRAGGLQKYALVNEKKMTKRPSTKGTTTIGFFKRTRHRTDNKTSKLPQSKKTKSSQRPIIDKENLWRRKFKDFLKKSKVVQKLIDYSRRKLKITTTTTIDK